MKKFLKITWQLIVLSITLAFLSINSSTSVLAAEDGECFVSGINEKSEEHFVSKSFTVSQKRGDQICYFPGSCISSNENVKLSIDGVEYIGVEKFDGKIDLEIFDGKGNKVGGGTTGRNLTINNGQISTEISLEPGENYTARIGYTKNFGGGILMTCRIRTSGKFNVNNDCAANSCQTEQTDADEKNSYNLCLQQVNNSTAQARCIECFNDGGIWTAVGCVPQTADGIISTIMQLGLIIAGAVVLIMILVGSFMLSTSQGDPKKAQEAKEMITSAIIGLLFVIFSITILQFIGISIIKIPGFGE